MAQKWQTVRVFVSSTFNDMHAERDYLVKRVYPELRDWGERRKLDIVDIDLRWGVTESEATEYRDTVRRCFECIDLCRPYFICFLGQRYGWKPADDQVSATTLESYPGLASVLERELYSMTELEVRHAISRPFGAEGGPRSASCHSFFYARDGSFLDALPDQPSQLRALYADQEEAQQQALQRLIGEIERLGRPVRQYAGTWRTGPHDRTPELALPLSPPSRRPEAVAQWRRDWQRGAGLRPAKDEIEEDSRQAAKAHAYNWQLTRGRLTDFRCLPPGGPPVPLSEVVLSELKEALLAEHPDRSEEASENELQTELEQHEQIRFHLCKEFIERPNAFARLDAHVRNPASDQVIAVTGGSGTGKSTLLAKWVGRYLDGSCELPATTFHLRFVGISAGSANMDSLVRSILLELRAIHGRSFPVIPEESEELRKKWPELIAGRSDGTTVIVLDALDQLDTGLTGPSWMPDRLPPGLKLVVSYRSDAGNAELFTHSLSHANTLFLDVQPFDDEGDLRRLAEQFLWYYLKRLDEPLLGELLSFPGATNPLFLKVVLSELRVFGSYAGLRERIRSAYGDTPQDAFTGLLKRLEQDPAPLDVDGPTVVLRLFGALAHARRGLSDDELVHLVLAAWPSSSRPRAVERQGALPDERPQAILDAIRFYLRQVQPFIVRRQGINDFYYESLRAAALHWCTARRSVRARPLRAKDWHAMLAAAFRAQAETEGTSDERWRGVPARVMNELAYHVSRTDRVEDTLALYSDFSYLEAMCVVRRSTGKGVADLNDGIYDLVANTQDALRYLWTSAPPNAGRRGQESRTESYYRSMEALTRIERSLSLEIHTLVHWNSDTAPAYLAQQLYNRALELEASEFAETAERRLGRLNSPTMKRLGVTEKSPPSRLRTLVGHSEHVTALEIAGDGRTAFSASQDGSLRRWDLDTGRTLIVFEGHTKAVTAMASSADGYTLVSGSSDRSVKLWDANSGRILHTFLECSDQISAMAMTPDGKTAISGGEKGEVHIWNLQDHTSRAVVDRHSERVNQVRIGAHSQRAVSASNDCSLKVWDLTTGQCLQTLVGHTGAVIAVDMSDNGRRIISGSFDEEVNLRLWEAEKPHPARSIEDHFARVDSVTLIHGAQVALTTSLFSPNIRLRDLAHPNEYRTLTTADSVSAIVVTPDRSKAVSLAADRLQRWDLGKAWLDREVVCNCSAGAVLAIDATASRALLGGDSGELTLWGMPEHAPVRDASGISPAHTARVNSISLFADGTRAATASDDGTIRIWDLASGLCRRVLKGHDFYVTSLAATADGKRLVSGSSDRTVRIWDAERGKLLRTLTGHDRPAARHAAPGTWTGPADPQRERDPSVRAMLGGVNAIALSADGRRVVSASDDFTARVWDLETGSCQGVFEGHTSPVRSVALTPDGTRAVSGSWDHTIRVWNPDSCREFYPALGHPGEVGRVRLSRHGRIAVSGCNDDALRVWDLGRGALLHTLKECEASFVAIAISADDRFLVACGDDMIIWDLKSGERVRQFPVPRKERAAACSLALTRDGRFALATWVAPAEVQVWDLSKGTRAAAVVVDQVVNCLALAHECSTLVTGGIDGNVSFFKLVGF